MAAGVGSREKRRTLIVAGLSTGAVQIWDLSTMTFVGMFASVVAVGIDVDVFTGARLTHRFALILFICARAGEVGGHSVEVFGTYVTVFGGCGLQHIYPF